MEKTDHTRRWLGMGFHHNKPSMMIGQLLLHVNFRNIYIYVRYISTYINYQPSDTVNNEMIMICILPVRAKEQPILVYYMYYIMYYINLPQLTCGTNR